MNLKVLLTIVIILAVGTVAVVAMQHEQGPYEKAKSNVEETMDDTSDAMHQAGDDFEEAYDDAKDQVEDAAR